MSFRVMTVGVSEANGARWVLQAGQGPAPLPVVVEHPRRLCFRVGAVFTVDDIVSVIDDSRGQPTAYAGVGGVQPWFPGSVFPLTIEAVAVRSGAVDGDGVAEWVMRSWPLQEHVKGGISIDHTARVAVTGEMYAETCLGDVYDVESLTFNEHHHEYRISGRYSRLSDGHRDQRRLEQAVAMDALGGRARHGRTSTDEERLRAKETTLAALLRGDG